MAKKLFHGLFTEEIINCHGTSFDRCVKLARTCTTAKYLSRYSFYLVALYYRILHSSLGIKSQQAQHLYVHRLSEKKYDIMSYLGYTR